MKFRIVALLLLAGVFSSCQRQKEVAKDNNITAIVGGTILGTSGQTPIADGILLIQDGVITAAGSRADFQIPEAATVVDASGKFLMPGIINAHGHIGDVEGLESGKYSRANVIRDLKLNAFYGVTTINSLGGDQQVSIDIRNEQDTVKHNFSRIFVAGAVVAGDTPEEALRMVEENVAMGVDFIKIRIDDNLGTAEKMKPEVYEAVINRGAELGIPVAAHIFYQEDAKAMLRLGVKFIAHSVRDQIVDEDFIQLMLDKEAYYCPTLMREVSTFVYQETPAFFNDPFFLKAADTALLLQLKEPERQQRIKESKTAQGYKRALQIAMQNLKILSDRGVKIAMGTDAGPPARFQGYFEHEEMKLMVEAGLTTLQALEAGTKTAAASIHQPRLGTLEKGNFADFLILKNNPLEDILHTRSIESVYIGGRKLPD
ncbi:MAG: amidohydrolase family protein [Cyclobacteriaceae bacterium]